MTIAPLETADCLRDHQDTPVGQLRSLLTRQLGRAAVRYHRDLARPLAELQHKRRGKNAA